MYCKSIFILVIDTTLTSDNPLLFRKNLLGMIGKLTMAIDDWIRDKKKAVWYSQRGCKQSALSSSKTDKQKHLAVEEILLSSPNQIIQQVKFTYSPFRERFCKANRKTGWHLDVFKPA